MRTIFCILIFSVSIALKAQVGNTNSIYITSQRKGLYVDIHCQENNVIIVYALRDSTRMTRFQRDSLSRVWEKAGSQEELKKLGESIMDPKTKRSILNIKYGCFTRDTMVLTKAAYPDYCDFISNIIQEDEDELRRDNKEGNWVTLDGTFFSITCLSNDELLWYLFIHSPRNDSYPLIYRLISETLGIYRTKYPNSFLDKSKIRIGY